jgi:hypothetical protein
VNTQNIYGRTPLFQACKRGDHEAVGGGRRGGG